MKNKLLILFTALVLHAYNVESGTINTEEEKIKQWYEAYIKEQKIDSNSISLIRESKLEGEYDKETRKAIRQMVNRLKINEKWFYQLLRLESGGDPKAVNYQKGDPIDPLERIKKGRAVGNIQFTPSTAKNLGTTTMDLYNMSMLEQLPYTEKYMRKLMKGKDIKTFLDLYLVVFYPYASGKSLDTVLGIEDSPEFAKKVYRYNKSMDQKGNNNGLIEKSDVQAWISGKIS